MTLLLMKARKAWRGNAHLVGEERDLDQVLDHDAEHDVVGDLADARELAVADVGDALRRDLGQDRRHRLAGRVRVPESTAESLPALITFALPLTGAQTNSLPS